jgi:hypothetical protein
MLSEKQKATNWETLQHIEMVMQLLAAMQHEISRRMFSHDRSKLESPEMEMFEQFTHRLAELTYGSDEYKQCLEEMKQSALLHHYENNRHHPEFFKGCPKDVDAIAKYENLIAALKQLQPSYPTDSYAIGQAIDLAEAYKQSLESNVNGMNLIDIVEMVCDWKAATLRHNDGNIYRSVEINKDRFGISPQLVAIISNTIPLLNRIHSARTQKHLNEYWHCFGCGSGGMEGNFCAMCGAGKDDYITKQPAELLND